MKQRFGRRTGDSEGWEQDTELFLSQFPVLIQLNQEGANACSVCRLVQRSVREGTAPSTPQAGRAFRGVGDEMSWEAAKSVPSPLRVSAEVLALAWGLPAQRAPPAHKPTDFGS